MAVYLIEENKEKYPWIINDIINDNGLGKFLKPEGFYVKCHADQAPVMTKSEALAALGFYNKRFGTNVGIRPYYK